jgi:acyl carrier protein
MQAWDSLKTLLIVSMLEITYDITLDNDDIEQLTTVRAARQIVERHAGR